MKFFSSPVKKSVYSWISLSFAICFQVALFSLPIAAQEQSLEIKTESHVSENGQVGITLMIRNISKHSVFNIQPIFHFHHSMHKMPPINRLEAGETISQKTSAHPAVLRIGRYPLMAVVKYKSAKGDQSMQRQAHADSFYFSEPVESVIEGELTTQSQAEGHLLKIQLNNNSPSLKNIRVILHLPPELVAKSFNGMMGFTMRPNEKKIFEVPVKKRLGMPGGEYPIHLMVEYAEMLKHYASVIPGEIHYSLSWKNSSKWAQLLVFIFLFGSIIWFLRNRSREAVE